MAMAMQADITFDLGLAPSVLAALRSPQTVRRIVLAAAESYNDDIHDWIDGGNSFNPTNGQLQQSINWRPSGEGAEVYANADYARYVEQGTGEFAGHSRWVIAPKAGRQALKIPSSTGGYFFRRSVIHPGSRPFPFFIADAGNRQNNMISAGRSVLAAEIAGAGNG